MQRNQQGRKHNSRNKKPHSPNPTHTPSATTTHSPMASSAANIGALNHALFRAILNDSFPDVNRLIAAGAQVDNLAGDEFTITNRHSLLYLATFRGKKNIVERLLAASKASINTPNVDGSTPLHAACQQGHTDIVQILIASGAGTDTPDKDGETPLFTASGYGHHAIVSILLKNTNAGNQPNGRGTTPLFIACQNGYISIAIDLLNAGSNIDLVNTNGNTPLHVAAISGHADIVNLLLSRGANSSLSNISGKTAYECFINDNKLRTEQREAVMAAFKDYKIYFHYLANDLFSMWELLCATSQESTALKELQKILTTNNIEKIDEIVTNLRNKLSNTKDSHYDTFNTGLEKLRAQLMIYLDEYNHCKLQVERSTRTVATQTGPNQYNPASSIFIPKAKPEQTPIFLTQSSDTAKLFSPKP